MLYPSDYLYYCVKMINNTIYFLLSPHYKKMACVARIKTGERPIPGSDQVCFTGGECGKEGFKKIVLDDGDSYFMICKDCFKQFLTKGSKTSSWNGWFDCEYPPNSRFYGSQWWFQEKQKGVKAVVHETSSPSHSPVSKKEMLEKKFTELNAFLKSPTKKTQKEVISATREIMKVRAELTLLD